MFWNALSMAKSLKKSLIVVMTLTGTLALAGSSYFFGSSIYIHAKAQLGQFLLQQTWQKTIVSQQYIKPWLGADFSPFAELGVSTSENKIIVLNNTSNQSLSWGPSFHQQTSYPGTKGRTIIAVHRDTHGRFLRNLKEGDLVTLTIKEGKQLLYSVDTIAVIDSLKSKLRTNSIKHELILYSCYPLDAVRPGGSMRYVVRAILIKEKLGKLYAQN